MTYEQIKIEVANRAEKFSRLIAPIYSLLGWEWCNSTPNGIDIEDTVNELLCLGSQKSMESYGKLHLSTGGISITTDPKNPNHVYLEMRVGVTLYFDDDGNVTGESWPPMVL